METAMQLDIIKEDLDYDHLYTTVERYLRNYNSYKVYVKLAFIELEELKEDYRGIIGISYDVNSGSTSRNISSPVEKETIQKIEEINKLEKQVKFTQRIIERIDSALSVLEEDQRDIITLFYFSNESWYSIGYKKKMGERTCRYIRNKGIKKMILAIFGV